MTPEFTAYLQYGVLGICSIALILSSKIIYQEQKREGSPRKGILKSSVIFMVFSFSIAIINGYVQLKEKKESYELEALRTKLSQREEELQKQLIKHDKLESQLYIMKENIISARSALQPIRKTRGIVVNDMAAGVSKNILESINEQLDSIILNLENNK